jgi:hypothetical protein
MRRIPIVVAGLLVVGAFAATAAYAALSASTLTSTNAANTAAGKPTPTNVLLCGTQNSPGSDRVAGSSNIDHPSGRSAMGNEYAYTGQNCEDETSMGGFKSSSDMFTWTIGHSNVNLVTEKGTEHGAATLTTTDGFVAGFNGRIGDYDFAPADSDPIVCGDQRQVFYASGHKYDNACPTPSQPGNYNTHGGASTGQHYRGQYGTLFYQDDNNNSCKTGSMSYCFQAIIQGQQN